ncbi:MAG: Cof-type HAD-IIB family hydrolase [Endozoicomonadaceae bacterium]|nr:Cof-type HAD-IIB family hydrolase [Endozoicomonadaceae bacterium]
MLPLIVSDLDGTLLTPEHQLGAYTTKVLKQLHQRGHRLVLATGRHAIEVSYFLKQADIPAFMITANGARITDDNNNRLFHRDIPSAIAHEIITFLMDKPHVTVHLYNDTGWYFNKEDENLIPYHQGTPLPRYRYTLDQLPHTALTKLFLCCQDTAQIASYEYQLQARFGEQVTIVCSMPWCIEVMAAGINKGAALQQIVRSLDLTEQQCIAFGDGMNDIDMLTAAGQGLIMENASDRLKHRLPEHEVIGTNANEAVAAYLEKNFLLHSSSVTAVL